MRRRRFLVLGLFLLGAGALPGLPLYAADAPKSAPFITAQDLDLTRFLPPPPANDSVQTKQELAEVLSVQVMRTPEMVSHVQYDEEQNVWIFADVMGPKFKAEALPKFATFFARVAATEGPITAVPKEAWKRPRPFVLSDLVRPVAEKKTSASYPSGHTTVGTLMGIVLADMIPEKKTEIMTRTWEYGANRLVGGVHFRSDIEMGRISGSLIAANIMARDDFKAEFGPAKAELRTLLGLGS